MAHPSTPTRPPLGRAAWHRRAGLVPLTYLAAILPAASAYPLIPQSRWLLIHLLLLGAATNAIMVWGAHFAATILRVPAPPGRRPEAARLLLLNAGVIAVLAGGTVGPGWVGVAGAAAVFVAVLAHLWVLAEWLGRALPARFAITVRYYLAASVALLAGIPAGAWMLMLDDADRPRLLLFHAHVNLLGWVTLTVLGTLLTLWPTVLRTRMAAGATRATARAFPLCLVGLGCLSLGTLAWWPVLCVAGLGLFAAAIVLVALPGVATLRHPVPVTPAGSAASAGSAGSAASAGSVGPVAPAGSGRPARLGSPGSFSAASIAAGIGWLLVSLGWDAWMLLRAGSVSIAADGFDTVLVPLAVGFVAQVLLGALAYLLPMVLGGGPARVRESTAALDRYWPQRVVAGNAALVGYLLPVPAPVRVTALALLLAVLIASVVPALRLLLSGKKRG